MQPGSSIINIGSVWGILAGMGGGSYCAVKAALIGLTQSIVADYGAQGIRANLVAPGVVRTDMTEGFWETEGFKRTNHELTPFNRDCTIEDEIGRAVCGERVFQYVYISVVAGSLK